MNFFKKIQRPARVRTSRDFFSNESKCSVTELNSLGISVNFFLKKNLNGLVGGFGLAPKFYDCDVLCGAAF